MKPRKETELVEVTYWACSIAGHRHKTESVAAACIAKNSGPKVPVRRWTRADMADACEAIINGETLAIVGKRFNVTAKTMGRITTRAFGMMMCPSRLSEPMPDNTYGYIDDIRKHPDFWLRQLAKFRADEAK